MEIAGGVTVGVTFPADLLAGGVTVGVTALADAVVASLADAGVASLADTDVVSLAIDGVVSLADSAEVVPRLTLLGMLPSVRHFCPTQLLYLLRK